MKIYHTCTSRPDLQRARDAAPSYDHGVGSIPARVAQFDEPWFLDNGAFSDQWAPLDFIGALEKIDDVPREPDFVVLPDVWADAGPSVARSGKWAGLVESHGVPFYLPVQDGLPVETGVRAAVELGASGVFVGGTDVFTRELAGQFVMTAHDYGLACHIGKPGTDLSWARDVGADSVDTASIVRNGYWNRLRKLEATEETEQMTIADGGTANTQGTEGSE